jgi:arginine/serine-rich splicing factor 12
MINNDNTIKATNISTFASEAMVHQIFEYIGKIKSLKLYPNPGLEGGKECLVEFEDSEAAGLALHLTGTKLYDRVFEVKIRTLEEIEQQKQILAISSMFNTPPAFNPILQPNITVEKANKIARTVYVGNLNTSITEKELIDFFSVCGPISYAKMAGDVSHPSRFAFLEFATIDAAKNAMNMSGSFFRDKIIKVNHSNNVINKGFKKNESQEIMEAIKGVKEAELLINRKYSEIPTDTGDQLKIVGSSGNPEMGANLNDKPEGKLIPGTEIHKELEKPHHSRSRSDYYRYVHSRRDRDRERDRERERDRDRERRHKERYERELEREHELMRERERERERERRRRESRSRSSSRRRRYGDRERDHYRR